MTVLEQQSVEALLSELPIDSSSELDTLIVFTVSEYFREYNCFAEHEIAHVLHTQKHNAYLARYGIRPFMTSDVLDTADVFIQLRDYLRNLDSFVHYLVTRFPYLIKNEYIIKNFRDNPLDFCTLLCMLVQYAEDHSDAQTINGVYLADRIFDPNAYLFHELGVDSLDVFFNCWESLNYYHVREKQLYIPTDLKKLMDLSVKHNIPHSVIFKQYADLKLFQKEIASAFNPWIEWRKQAGLSQVESGITLEETVFNENVLRLRKKKPTDVVNALFYKTRNDVYVETCILMNNLRIEIEPKSSLLVVNPSPDFLTDFGQYDWFLDKVIFAVPDSRIADVYKLQFQESGYQFIALSDLRHCNDKVDYIVICARDLELAEYIDCLSVGQYRTQVIAFLPQTEITAKDATLIDRLTGENLYVSKILSLPNRLSESRGRKKMILYARRGIAQPESFVLLQTAHQQVGNDHYVHVIRKSRRVDYTMLFKRRTLKQMADYHDKIQQDASDAPAKRKNAPAKVYQFSKEIRLPYSVYSHPSGAVFGRACFRTILPENSNRANGALLIDYFSTGSRKSEADILAKLEYIVLAKEEYAEKISAHVEQVYSKCPESLTLKTVWYCNRRFLKTELNYDDNIAIKMFCAENQTLANLVIGEATAETVEEALKVLFAEKISDLKYYRLLRSVFRIAVERGYLASNPLAVKKTAYPHQMQHAMQQLRDALKKDSLSLKEIRRMLNYLLEPIDDQQTPRAVKDSTLLIALIRLCTGMPIREICALEFKHFQRIGNQDAWQLHVVQILNNAGKVIPITTHRYIRKYRVIPCVSVLSHALQQRCEYLKRHYGFTDQQVPDLPIAFSQEPTVKRKGRKRRTAYCSIRQARKACQIVLEQAQIPSNIIRLLDGEDSFIEDLNACRNDIYYSNFLHYANRLCGLNEGEVCFLVGRKGHTTFSDHYVDYRNEYIQLDMAIRLERLWKVVAGIGQLPAAPALSAQTHRHDHVISVPADQSGLASIELTLRLVVCSNNDPVQIQIGSEHGLNGYITTVSETEVPVE
jgi:integrase